MPKKMRIEWSSRTLEAKGHWATIKELQKVILFHLESTRMCLVVVNYSPNQFLLTNWRFAQNL